MVSSLVLPGHVLKYNVTFHTLAQRTPSGYIIIGHVHLIPWKQLNVHCCTFIYTQHKKVVLMQNSTALWSRSITFALVVGASQPFIQYSLNYGIVGFSFAFSYITYLILLQSLKLSWISWFLKYLQKLANQLHVQLWQREPIHQIFIPDPFQGKLINHETFRLYSNTYVAKSLGFDCEISSSYLHQ